MALSLLAAAPAFLGSLGGAGGAAPVAAPAGPQSAASAGPTTQTQHTSFGSSFAVGGGSAASPIGAGPASSFVQLGGFPLGTLALVAAAGVGALLLLRR